MKKIVISIGGSVILPEENNATYLRELASLLKKHCGEHKIFLVAGGGKTARKYIKLGRLLGFNEEILDSIGIDITRINAKLLTNILQVSNEEIPCTTDEAKNVDKPIVVMGGTTPGHSTDMVAAELAEKTNADLLIIATNVDGIYDKDPNRYSDAKQLKEVKIDQLIKNYGVKWKSAGENIVVDGPALEIIKKARLVTYVVNGRRLDQLERAIKNQSFNGTRITL
jgi:uridylate kinase